MLFSGPKCIVLMFCRRDDRKLIPVTDLDYFIDYFIRLIVIKKLSYLVSYVVRFRPQHHQTSDIAQPSAIAESTSMVEISIDLLVHVLLTSIFHPFITFLIPLCQRALARPWTDPSIIISIVWASLVSVGWLLAKLNRQLAFGLPRPIHFTPRRHRRQPRTGDDDDDDDDDDEVVVITGGARGLGLLMAEAYAMRGASVAAVDVVDMTDSVFAARERINWYRCDVGDRSQVEDVNRRITEDVCFVIYIYNIYYMCQSMILHCIFHHHYRHQNWRHVFIYIYINRMMTFRYHSPSIVRHAYHIDQQRCRRPWEVIITVDGRRGRKVRSSSPPPRK